MTKQSDWDSVTAWLALVVDLEDAGFVIRRKQQKHANP